MTEITELWVQKSQKINYFDVTFIREGRVKGEIQRKKSENLQVHGLDLEEVTNKRDRHFQQ